MHSCNLGMVYVVILICGAGGVEVPLCNISALNFLSTELDAEFLTDVKDQQSSVKGNEQQLQSEM